MLSFASNSNGMNLKLILLIAIASLCLSVCMAQIHKNMIAKQSLIREQEVEINYYEKGEGDKTLLFIHGWCIDANYWEHQIEYFSKSYKTIAIELPGFGQSKAQRKNWTIEEYAKDIIAFIKELALKDIVLIGHSMAGEIMLQIALSNNPNILGIVGIDNFKLIDVEFSPEELKQMNEFFPTLKNDFKNSAPAYAEMMLFHSSTPTKIKERVKADFANSNPEIGYSTCMNQMQFLAKDAQRLEMLDYKLNLINSDYTPTNEIGLKCNCKSGYHIEIINDTGHYPMVEKPEKFNNLLEKVLNKI